MTLQVRVITPDKIVWDDDAQEIILPSTTGQLGILTNHAPLLTAIDIGVMQVRSGKEWKAIAVMGGFAEVENNEVKVLVNGAQMGDSIDSETARAEFEQAKQRLEQAKESGNRQQQIQASQVFKRTMARFQASGGMVQI